MNKNGQAVSAEYVMIFFLIVATITFMGTYVKRAFQARMYDAKETMADLAGADICQYEPYYKDYVTNSSGSTSTTKNIDHGAFIKTINSATTMDSVSNVLDPSHAD